MLKLPSEQFFSSKRKRSLSMKYNSFVSVGTIALVLGQLEVWSDRAHPASQNSSLHRTANSAGLILIPTRHDQNRHPYNLHLYNLCHAAC